MREKLKKIILLEIAIITTGLVVMGYSLFFSDKWEQMRNSDHMAVGSSKLEKDLLLKSYEAYLDFIMKTVSTKDYEYYKNYGPITKSMFQGNDYLAVSYESNVCVAPDNFPIAVKIINQKVYLKVFESISQQKCFNVGFVHLVPVKKDQFKTMPEVIKITRPSQNLEAVVKKIVKIFDKL